jgi:hypothetical protein
MSGSEVSPDHWKTLKIPALEGLFRTKIQVLDDLNATIDMAGLPKAVAAASRKRTGFVNFRNVWRSSSRKWCISHLSGLRPIITDASHWTSLDDRGRLRVAAKIGKLPHVPSPAGTLKVSPASFLTPLIASIDPSSRFPIINARKEVQHLLASVGLANDNVELQAKGLVGLIGHFGLSDAFMIDVLADKIAGLGPDLAKLRAEVTLPGKGSLLPYYDESERDAVNKSDTQHYRDRHDKMTNALKRLFGTLKLTRGTAAHCRYDVLAENYDSDGRDLLMEVKPDPDKGSLRIAIGQLFDYRRYLPRQAGTDLAVLTISTPSKPYLGLLHELHITALWFENESCDTLRGDGPAWAALEDTVNITGDKQQ